MAGVRSWSTALQSFLRCNQHAPSAGLGGNLLSLGGRSRRRRPSIPDHPRLSSCGPQALYYQWLFRPIRAQTSAGTRLARYSARARQDRNAGFSAALTQAIPRQIRSVWSHRAADFNISMLWAAVCAGFFGCLRPGEFTTDGSFDPARHLSRKISSLTRRPNTRGFA